MRSLARLGTAALAVSVLPAFFGMVRLGLPPLGASVAVLTAVAAVLLLLEWRWPRGGLGERPAGTRLIDAGYTTMSAVLNVGVPSLFLVPFAAAHAPRWSGAVLWPQDLPRALDILLCLLLADFVSYWWHRLEHDPRLPLLWRLHSVHHAPRYFDFLMGGHVHPLDVVVFISLTSGLAALLGVPTLTIDASMLFAGVVGAMHHLNAETDCGWLNRIVPFADHHAVHHSLAREDNGNFGNITTIWDQVFGTWMAPRPEVPFPTGSWALAEDYPHADPLFQLRSPFGEAWRRAAGGETSGGPA